MALMLLQQERSDETAAYQTLAEDRATVHRRDVTLIRMRLLNDDDLCEESRALAQDWLDARPYSISAKRMVGVSYLCDRDFSTAATYFRQTLDALPESVGDARLLAIAYARDDKALEARAALNEIRAISTDDPLYYQALYETHLMLGQLDEAVAAAQRWQVLRPENLDAREAWPSCSCTRVTLRRRRALRSTRSNAARAPPPCWLYSARPIRAWANSKRPSRCWKRQSS